MGNGAGKAAFSRDWAQGMGTGSGGKTAAVGVAAGEGSGTMGLGSSAGGISRAACGFDQAMGGMGFGS